MAVFVGGALHPVWGGSNPHQDSVFDGVLVMCGLEHMASKVSGSMVL